MAVLVCGDAVDGETANVDELSAPGRRVLSQGPCARSPVNAVERVRARRDQLFHPSLKL